MIYPTFSMGSLDDRIQVNFGQTQFLFNLKAKTNVSHFINVYQEYYKTIFDEISV